MKFQEDNQRVAIFAGPSGGHLFPALAFAEELRHSCPDREIYLFTSNKARKWRGEFSKKLITDVFYLPNFPFSSGISLRTFTFLLQLPWAFWISYRTLSHLKPGLCVGFGSYVSFPGMLAAKWMGFSTLIHEQNYIPGKATKGLARHVDCVAVSFAETFEGRHLKRREVTGLPIRAKLAGREGNAFGEVQQKFRILVIGGSQGSHRLNSVFLDSLECLSPEERHEIAVIHITGQADFEWVSKTYEKLGVSGETHPFFESMQALYARTDLAVTRAGANTLFELAMYQIPAIVVPYPFAGAHQSANAKYFQSRQAVVLQEEKDLTCDWLYQELKSLKNDLPRRSQMAHAIAGISVPNAAQRLAEVASDLAKWESNHDTRQS